MNSNGGLASRRRSNTAAATSAPVAGCSDRQRGQSFVEFALLLPIALAIVMGVLDLGRAMYAYVAISNAAQAGAEYAARPHSAAVTETAIKTAALGEAGPFLESQSGSITVRTASEVGGAVTLVRVTIDYPFEPIISGGEIVLSATAVAPLTVR